MRGHIGQGAADRIGPLRGAGAAMVAQHAGIAGEPHQHRRSGRQRRARGAHNIE